MNQNFIYKLTKDMNRKIVSSLIKNRPVLYTRNCYCKNECQSPFLTKTVGHYVTLFHCM